MFTLVSDPSSCPERSRAHKCPLRRRQTCSFLATSADVREEALRNCIGTLAKRSSEPARNRRRNALQPCYRVSQIINTPAVPPDVCRPWISSSSLNRGCFYFLLLRGAIFRPRSRMPTSSCCLGSDGRKPDLHPGQPYVYDHGFFQRAHRYLDLIPANTTSVAAPGIQGA